MKLRKGNVFTPVCQSFTSQGGVYPSMHWVGGVCLWTWGCVILVWRGVSASSLWGSLTHTSPWADTPNRQIPPSQTPPRQTPPRQTIPIGRQPPSQTPPRQILLRQTPPPPHQVTVTTADGTHPTGMHPCLIVVPSLDYLDTLHNADHKILLVHIVELPSSFQESREYLH